MDSSEGTVKDSVEDLEAHHILVTDARFVLLTRDVPQAFPRGFVEISSRPCGFHNLRGSGDPTGRLLHLAAGPGSLGVWIRYPSVACTAEDRAAVVRDKRDEILKHIEEKTTMRFRPNDNVDVLVEGRSAVTAAALTEAVVSAGIFSVLFEQSGMAAAPECFDLLDSLTQTWHDVAEDRPAPSGQTFSLKEFNEFTVRQSFRGGKVIVAGRFGAGSGEDKMEEGYPNLRVHSLLPGLSRSGFGAVEAKELTSGEKGNIIGAKIEPRQDEQLKWFASCVSMNNLRYHSHARGVLDRCRGYVEAVFEGRLKQPKSGGVQISLVVKAVTARTAVMDCKESGLLYLKSVLLELKLTKNVLFEDVFPIEAFTIEEVAKSCEGIVGAAAESFHGKTNNQPLRSDSKQAMATVYRAAGIATPGDFPWDYDEITERLEKGALNRSVG